MPYATFSQIEFVGMAADRDIVLACSDVRKRASSSSSTITLVSVRTETERHDRCLMVSDFDINELYTPPPSSPSGFVIDFVPDALPSVIDGRSCRDMTSDDPNISSNSSWTSTPSVIIPLERYCRDSQRHERLAVSVALGRPCDILAVVEEAHEFRRSPAPSASTRQGLTALPGRQRDDVEADIDAGLDGDVASARSVADPHEIDYRSLQGNYSMERWFGATMGSTERLALESIEAKPQEHPVSPPSEDGSALIRHTVCKRRTPEKESSPSSSLSLPHIEPEIDPLPEDWDNHESIMAVAAVAFKRLEESRARRTRTCRPIHVRKRKWEEGHPQNPHDAAFPAPLSES